MAMVCFGIAGVIYYSVKKGTSAPITGLICVGVNIANGLILLASMIIRMTQ